MSAWKHAICGHCGESFSRRTGVAVKFCSRWCCAQAKRKPRGVCSVDGCGRPRKSRGLCNGHYWRVLRGNGLRPDVPIATQRRGQPCFRDGYVLLYRPEHPNAAQNGQVAEHRAVMSQILGRPLTADEHVHHKNGVRHDNRLENLELWTLRRQPPGQRVEDRLLDALRTLALYADDPLIPEVS